MVYEVYKNYNPRLRVFYVAFLVFILILTGGVIKKQIIEYTQYRKQERRQNMRRILMPASRGNIYDRNGKILVKNRPVFSAVVYLNELRPEFRTEYIRLVREARNRNENPDRLELQVAARSNVVQRYLDRIHQIIGGRDLVDRTGVERHFRKRLLLPLVLIRDLDLQDYARLTEQLPIESPIQIHTDSARQYPYGSAAAHTLGYVVPSEEISDEGVVGEDLTTFINKGKVGKSGIELSFNDRLQGTSGGEVWIVDPSGFQYERTTYMQPVKGTDLQVSLDIDMQIAAERAMGSKIGAVVALDSRTGEVMVLASKPDYNLNDLSPYISFDTAENIRERGAWLNRATQGLYPPGSTFKLITAMAAMKSGFINQDLIINCPGYSMVGKRRFLCHVHSGHGDVDINMALALSCNVFFYQSGLEAGVDAIARQAREFGLDKPTGIELRNGETHGMLVPDPEWKMKRFLDRWYDGDTANFSIGQGYLLITPMQMACVAASISRRETLTRPTLIHKPARNPFEMEHGGGDLGLTDEQYGMILEGMKTAVSVGTARMGRIPGIPMAGKTGTAQVFSQGVELSLAWFIGFAPADDPKVAIAVMIEGTDPNDNLHGGSTAAPIAKAVFETYFYKSGILPASKMTTPVPQ